MGLDSGCVVLFPFGIFYFLLLIRQELLLVSVDGLVLSILAKNENLIGTQIGMLQGLLHCYLHSWGSRWCLPSIEVKLRAHCEIFVDDASILKRDGIYESRSDQI
jgi:hypothetical protein